MKKVLLSIFILAATATCVNAQNLYKTVLERATEVVNSPSSSADDLSMSQFKLSALNYITTEMKNRNMQKDPYFYDSQAVNLESFLTDYKDNLAKAKAISAAKASEMTKAYKEATTNNPLLNDADKAKVNANITASSTTPFSLDTDWELAYDEATRKAKAILK